MNQDLFDFDAPPPAPPAPKSYHWAWGDAWPQGLTVREQLMRQVQRDLRAYDETGEAFYLERAEAYRGDLRRQGQCIEGGPIGA